MADVCALKADEIRLRRNQRPESELARSIVEEEAQNNDLTKFESSNGGQKKIWGVSLWLLYPLRVSLSRSSWEHEMP